MRNVTLNMIDEATGEPVERTIDITNAMISRNDGYVLGDEDSQRRQLERWIAERGNEQHETFLTLNSWTIA